MEKEVEDVHVRCPAQQTHKHHQGRQDGHRQKFVLKYGTVLTEKLKYETVLTEAEDIC